MIVAAARLAVDESGRTDPIVTEDAFRALVVLVALLPATLTPNFLV